VKEARQPRQGVRQCRDVRFQPLLGATLRCSQPKGHRRRDHEAGAVLLGMRMVFRWKRTERES